MTRMQAEAVAKGSVFFPDYSSTTPERKQELITWFTDRLKYLNTLASGRAGYTSVEVNNMKADANRHLTALGVSFADMPRGGTSSTPASTPAAPSNSTSTPSAPVTVDPWYEQPREAKIAALRALNDENINFVLQNNPTDKILDNAWTAYKRKQGL